ncbi:PQQ-binding-like beta-propeller repeat protein [Planctomycetota bacterium]
MMTESNDSKRIALYEAVKMTAFIAGLFSLIVVGVLVVSFLEVKLIEPIRTEKLELLKIKLLDEPGNEQMLSDIRQLDLKIRNERVGRNSFSRSGYLLLLAGIAVFLISVKSAMVLKKSLPHPEVGGDQQAAQIRSSKLARFATVIVMVVLAACVFYFAAKKKVDFAQAVASYPSAEEIAKNWPSFRGPSGSGVSAYTNIPEKWDGKTSEGVSWKSPVDLPGHNSPIVWGDKIFVIGADRNKRRVYCFDAFTGELLWSRDVEVSPAKKFEAEEDTGYAAPTAATDGKRICAIFPAGDIVCFDFEGNQLWRKDLGLPDSMYGYSSSLAVYQNLFIVQYDHGYVDDNKSMMIALDSFSGQIVWQTKRPVSSSWTSPIVADVNGMSQLITCGDPWVIAYDPANGRQLWRADCLGTDVAPSPIYAGGFIFAIQPYGEMFAIKPDGSGDVTNTHIAWKANDSGPDICSPVSDGEFIFALQTQGDLTCYKVSDGTKLWEKDLETSLTASPSIVGDRLYLLSEKGVMFIADIAGEYKQVGKNEMGEKCYATPAFVDGRIYIRTTKNLYCIGKSN